MSYNYYRRRNDDYGWGTIIICLIVLFMCTFGFNSCTESTWNDGKCIECDTRYELRGASRGYKYYACPECGQEVTRF